jgi:hypothetical protein
LFLSILTLNHVRTDVTGKLGAVKITGARGSIPLVLLSLQSV